MSPRKRKFDRDLPQRVYKHGKKYRFVPKKGKKIVLGETKVEALRKYAELYADAGLLTMEGVLEKYRLEELPKKAIKTQKDQSAQLDRLSAAIGHIPPESLTPQLVTQYLDYRGKTAQIAANRELALVRHVCKVCVARWGFMPNNPCREVQAFTRNREIESSPTKNFVHC
ncbi:hypothetical protein [Solemya elarraichensis gill symbiont]|uniref:Core-binding (CB) domain-containing protein n=1 Tax=Solemya elarraichensis gill symbiont TaxID=1918949 RepID=A0A1T2L3P2_9GAMM|nr:hypothetical protein [Solemya elarraichensis gill symbiont]OOZ39682.1 hypothetical protein BOW52_07000 [Solemya elarraichensis gill symbiont]